MSVKSMLAAAMGGSEPMPTSLDLDALSANTDWMTRLARRLVGDADADDLVQDAWMVALRSDAEPHPSPGWLAGVVKNLARMRRRGEERRKLREARAAKNGEAGSTADLVEQLSAQRHVADAVLALPDVVREAILLRYYRGRSLREIAAEQGITVAGVHRRIDRGHALLRKRLTHEYGGGKAWALSILTLAEPAGGGLMSPLGVLSMGVGLKIAATLAVVGGALGVYLFAGEDEASTTVLAEAPVEPEAEPTARPAAELVTRAGSGTRTTAPEVREAIPANSESTKASTDATAPHAALPTRTGRAIDVSGTALADVTVALVDEGGSELQRTRSDENGDFELERRGSWVELREPGWETVLPGSMGRSDELTVVAGRTASIAGWVIDEAGAPVEGAEVRVAPSADLFSQLSLLHMYIPPSDRWTTRTDVRGRFRFDETCSDTGMALVVEHPRYHRVDLALGTRVGEDLEVVLIERGGDGQDVVWGTVVDSASEPVAEAYVAWGGRSTRSDTHGRFRIEDSGPSQPETHAVDDGATLRALKAGYLPAVLVTESDAITSPVELRLGSAPLKIAGQVVDASGAPVPGALVWIGDPTSFGMIAHDTAGGQAWIHATQESLLKGGSPWDRGTAADDEGRFEITGLLERDYVVLACKPGSMEGGQPNTIAAGTTHARIVVSEPGVLQRVSGRFVSANGTPIAGLRVLARRTFAADRMGYGAPTQYDTTVDPVTDEDGRVTFEELAVSGTELSFNYNGRYLPPGFQLESVNDPGDFEHTLALPCRMQVDTTKFPGSVDRFSVVDADGTALSMLMHGGNFSYSTDDAPIGNELSSVLEVAERAAAVVLWNAEGEEIARRGVTLDPNELTLVEF